MSCSEFSLRPALGIDSTTIATKTRLMADKRAHSAAATRPRIVHLAAPATFGGLETVVAELAAGLHDIGCTVTVLAILEPRQRLPSAFDMLSKLGIEVRCVAVAPRHYVFERALIKRELERTRPDILHTHGYRPDVIGGSAARAAGVHRVSTVHGFTARDHRGRLFEWLERRYLARFDAVVAVSRPLETQLVRSGINPSIVRCIPNRMARATATNRLEARRRLGLTPESWVVGWVGRLSEEKGPDVAVRALGLLTDPTIKLCVVGDGPEREALGSLARSLAVEDRLVMTGAVAEAGSLMPAFDVLLLSSRTEGTPMVLLEAASARVPIVATRVGGVPDLVGEAGALLVESGDFAQMAQALESTKRDYSRALERAHRLHSFVASPDAGVSWASQYRQVYERVLASG